MAKATNYQSEILDDLLNEIDPKEMRKTEKRMSLAAKIADCIKAKGWSKSEFAGKMNKQPSVITKWLSGTHNFNSDTLFDIEEALDFTLLPFSEKTATPTMSFTLSISQSANVPTSSVYSTNHPKASASLNTEQIIYGNQPAHC
ncbi:helix-turn-helix domain-containing protein [Owenweeksia hongkongensis]|uniref:helix-turn-helix domain-containing protein n=1 Tax=Owenweeksia hongkongensis TaxID=253245 RepID=UPI003A917BE0